MKWMRIVGFMVAAIVISGCDRPRVEYYLTCNPGYIAKPVENGVLCVPAEQVND